jgi:hypothetical protein
MSRARRTLFGLFAVVLVLGLVELLSALAHAFVFGGVFSYEAVEQERLRLADVPAASVGSERPRDQENDNSAQTIHPYLGYVLNPERSPLWPVNEYGFIGNPPPFEHDELAGDLSSRPVSIAVVGGSVAETLSTSERGLLLDALASQDAFAGREIRITSLAIRGMKQPQQLMTVDWFASLGARFDVVINLDGFNEIFGASENVRLGTFPFYPRRWAMLSEGIQDPKLLARAGRIVYLEELRADFAALVSASAMRYSVTVNVLWELVDRGLASRITSDRGELDEALLDREAATRPYEVAGPARPYPSEDARYRDLAAYWKKTSVLLHQKARAYGFHYFHFLQPNQYVADSKPMGPEERAIALPPRYAYRKSATAGYPRLIAAGKQLSALGVPFRDLTMMFREVEEPVYSDGCCHFNARGNELIAQEVARVIGEALGAEQGSTAP